MVTKIQIPKQEKKTNLIGFKLTDSQLKAVKEFCREKNITFTFLMINALKNIVPNFKN